ncbi:MAG: S41 family peptidase [Chloroflexota bacterium]
MKQFTRFFLFFPLLLSIACMAVTGLPHPTPTLLPASTYPTQPPTVTLLPATSTAAPTNTLSAPVTPSAEQTAIFEQLWQVVHDEYLYPDYNGADWEAIHQEFSARVSAGLTPEAFYQAMDEMIARLNDEHSVFLSPQEAAEEDAEFAGENDYVGIGILTAAVPERQRATVIVVFPDSPAEKAGLRSHDSILSVDGQPILDEFGFLRSELLRGPQGSTIEILAQTPGQAPRTLSVTRQRIFGALPVPFQVFTTPSGKRIGYLLIASLGDETVDEQVGKALREMTRSAPLAGLILDNRQNPGGADSVAKGVLSYFTDGRLGYFADRHQKKRWFSVNGRDVGGSSRLPLVVLIGPDTVSFGEIISGILQDQKRAYLIGETTTGNIELLWSYEFPDGSRAWIAHEAFHPTNHPEVNWEKSGITPDLLVSSNWDEITPDTDPAIQAALSYFEELHP